MPDLNDDAVRVAHHHGLAVGGLQQWMPRRLAEGPENLLGELD